MSKPVSVEMEFDRKELFYLLGIINGQLDMFSLLRKTDDINKFEAFVRKLKTKLQSTLKEEVK